MKKLLTLLPILVASCAPMHPVVASQNDILAGEFVASNKVSKDKLLELCLKRANTTRDRRQCQKDFK